MQTLMMLIMVMLMMMMKVVVVIMIIIFVAISEINNIMRLNKHIQRIEIQYLRA
jgi:hypothetical protein